MSNETPKHEIGVVNCGCEWHPSCIDYGGNPISGCPQCRKRRKWSREGFWYHTETGLAACEIQEIP